MLRSYHTHTLLLFAALAVANPETEPESYRSRMKRVTREQRIYANHRLAEDLTKALNALAQCYYTMKGRPETPNVWVYDTEGYKGAFDQWAEFERKKGVLAQELAREGGAAAAKQILSQLLDALDVIVAQEETMKDARPLFTFVIYDQEPAIRRYGAYQRRDVLVAALSQLSDAEGFAALLKEGWARACAWDRRRRSDLARVALLDALALTGNEGARPLLEEVAAGNDPRLRIAALEALALLAKEPEEIAPRLSGVARTDPCYAVRATALDLLATAARAPAVVPELAGALTGARGASERARIRRALASIVGMDLGEEPAPWQEWLEAKAQGREFKRDEMRLTTTTSGAAFDRPLLLLECTYIECVPADIDLAAKKDWFDWLGMAVENRTFLTQWDVQKRDAKELLEGLPEKAPFNFLVMRDICKVVPFEKDGMARAKTRTKRAACKFLDEAKPGIARTKVGNTTRYFCGWCSPSEGLWASYRQAGLDPWGTSLPDEPLADTILYSGEGVPALGPIIDIDAVIDDIRRLDRFFRIPIHCVRVGNTEGSEETMKGIATATRGSYRWLKKP